MSLKMKLISAISAFTLVLGLLIMGVFAVNQAQVDMGGSITFNADDVYARVTGSVANAQVAPNNLDVTYSAYETEGDPSAWEELDLLFDSQGTPIVITITVENLSAERSLTVNLTDTISSSTPNLNKSLQRDSSTYSSGTNITLDPKDNGTSATTFTITLSVADRNQSLTNAQFDYELNLYDENYEFPEIYDYFTFEVNEDGKTVTLTDYDSSLSDSTDMSIPATVDLIDGVWQDGNTYTVTAIDNNATSSSNSIFRNSGITSIELPSTLQIIGSYAFYMCSLYNVELPSNLITIEEEAFSFNDLTSLILPSNLTSIGDRAFFQCDFAGDISIPASVTEIGTNPFAGCSNLERIVVEEGNSEYYIESNCLIEDATKTLITGFNNSKIPNDIKIIGDYAFWYCREITRLDFPLSLINIGSTAFQGCGFTNIDISNCTNLISIGGSAFYLCTKLTSISLPSGLTTIKAYAFDDCSSLTSITIPSSVTDIENCVFRGCDSLEGIEVEEGNSEYYIEGNCLIEKSTKILKKGFNNSTIPNDIKEIEMSAFNDCNGLTSITLPASLRYLTSNYIFYRCTNLTEVTIDSEYVYTNATSTSECGGLFSNSSITTVKVLTSLVGAGENSYISTNFPNVTTEVIEGKNYTVYSK